MSNGSFLITITIINLAVMLAAFFVGRITDSFRQKNELVELKIEIKNLRATIHVLRDSLGDYATALLQAQLALISESAANGKTVEDDLLTSRLQLNLNIYNALIDYFNKVEIVELAFLLGFEDEEFGGQTVNQAARSLVVRAKRYGRLSDLRDLVVQKRPHVKL